MAGRILVVTFDLDNTLWDVHSVMRNAEQVLRTWFDAEVPEVNQTFEAEDLLALRNQIIEDDPNIVHNLTNLRRTTFLRSIEQSGYPGPEARRLANQAMEVFLDARHDVTYFDDALEVLEALASRYVLGALSNGNADVFRLGLGDFFSFDYSAAKVGAGKPAPDMFHAALNHAAALPSQMVHVGDHPEDDIRAAANLGIHTVWVNLAGARYPEDAPETLEVTRLADIPSRIEELST